MKGPRVFIGLVEIAGYYGGLARGLRELGVPVSHVTIREHPYYGCGVPHGSLAIRVSNWLTRLHERALARRLTRWGFKPVRWVHLRMLFLWAIAKHDVFVFSYGVSFFERRDLPVLKWLGKKLIFVFNGSDTRPPWMSGAYVADPVVSLAELSTITASSKQMVREVERYADVCVNHPLSAHFHEKPFANYLYIGNPGYIDVASRYDPAAPRQADESAPAPVRVVHAPSKPTLKGSDFFRAMVDRINVGLPRVEYVELRGRPHSEVLAELARCDFVIDELYSDISLAGLGTEAASFGKPALVGGYGRDALERARRGLPLPLDMYWHPEKLEAAFERLVSDEAWRRRCGETARIFVRDNWQPRLLAEKFLSLITGIAPADWFFDPKDIVYFHGWGVSEERLRQRLGELIAHCGICALQLADKPALERAVVEFARAPLRAITTPQPQPCT